ncbi:WYL domain-containing protein [Myxococcota bacterium]|nr:WYL domain-containing protein [Myxococcota bacterium]
MSRSGVGSDVRRLSLLAILMATRRPLSMAGILRRLPGFYLPEGQQYEDQDETTQESIRRKFNRDLAFLRSLGYRITYSPEDATDEEGYLLENRPTRRTAALSRDDLRTLRLIEGIGPLIRESPLDEALRMAFARIEALGQGVPCDPRNDAVVFSLRELGRPTLVPRVPEALLGTVTTALRDRNPLRLAYRSVREPSSRTRKVDPWGLFLKAGVWYLVGWCHLRNARRLFAMHRVEHAEILPGSRTVPPPADFSLGDWASREPWELPLHDPVEVTLELDEVASGLRHSRLRSAQASREGPDRPWKVRVQATNVDPLVGLVLGLWGHARIVDPPEVRDRLLAIVDRLVREHSEEPP